MICCYSLTDAKHLYKLTAHDGAVLRLCCTDKTIISLGADVTVKAWHMTKGVCLNAIKLVSHEIFFEFFYLVMLLYIENASYGNGIDRK